SSFYQLKCTLFPLHCGNYVLRCIRQTLCCNNIQATVSQFLRAEFGVVTFQTYHDRYVNTHFRYRADDTVSDQVATNDTTEDVNQNGLHFVYREDDLKRFDYTYYTCDP